MPRLPGNDELDVPDAAVARVSAVLTAFDARHEHLRVSEISRRAQLPKSTTSRLVSSLVAYGFLERDGPWLHVGTRLFAFGELASRHRRLRTIALPFMADLREATRQTVHLAVLDGAEVVYVEILRDRQAPRMPSEVGGRLPAHASAVGKASLAFGDPAATETVYRHRLRPVGPRTVTAPGLLRQELTRVRGTGLAYDNEESGPGVACVASPILDSDGRLAAAISISGWCGRLNQRRLGPLVHTTATGIGRDLDQSR